MGPSRERANAILSSEEEGPNWPKFSAAKLQSGLTVVPQFRLV